MLPGHDILAQVNTPTMAPWKVGLIGVMIVALTVMLRIMRKHATSADRIEKRLARNQPPVRAANTAELDQSMIEFEKLCRELFGQLDTKIARLESLIRDADRRIATLTPTDRPQPAEPVAPAVVDVELGAEEPEAPAQPDPADESRPPPGTSRKAKVLKLHAEKRDTIEIARRTGIPTGEVELILSLHEAASPDDVPAAAS